MDDRSLLGTAIFNVAVNGVITAVYLRIGIPFIKERALSPNLSLVPAPAKKPLDRFSPLGKRLHSPWLYPPNVLPPVWRLSSQAASVFGGKRVKM